MQEALAETRAPGEPKAGQEDPGVVVGLSSLRDQRVLRLRAGQSSSPEKVVESRLTPDAGCADAGVRVVVCLNCRLTFIAQSESQLHIWPNTPAVLAVSA